MNVQIKVNDEFKPCGQIYLTPEILQFFKSIDWEENWQNIKFVGEF